RSLLPCHLIRPTTPEIYTLSLHALFRSLLDRFDERIALRRVADIQHLADGGDLLRSRLARCSADHFRALPGQLGCDRTAESDRRSEEHTSELQSRFDLVCRLLLEKTNIA